MTLLYLISISGSGHVELFSSSFNYLIHGSPCYLTGAWLCFGLGIGRTNGDTGSHATGHVLIGFPLGPRRTHLLVWTRRSFVRSCTRAASRLKRKRRSLYRGNHILRENIGIAVEYLCNLSAPAGHMCSQSKSSCATCSSLALVVVVLSV